MPKEFAEHIRPDYLLPRVGTAEPRRSPCGSPETSFGQVPKMRPADGHEGPDAFDPRGGLLFGGLRWRDVPEWSAP